MKLRQAAVALNELAGDEMLDFAQQVIGGVALGCVYGLIALGFVLIYKATQVVNFAQGELLLVGAWVCWALLTKFQVPFWIGMPLTLVFMFAFGILIQVVVLRPMIGEPIISVIMVTIALSAVLLGELPPWLALVGGVVCLVGVGLSQRR